MDGTTNTLMTQIVLSLAMFALGILGLLVYAYLEYRKKPVAEQRVMRKRLLIALGHGTINLVKITAAVVVALFVSVFWLALKENPPSRRR